MYNLKDGFTVKNKFKNIEKEAVIIYVAFRHWSAGNGKNNKNLTQDN